MTAFCRHDKSSAAAERAKKAKANLAATSKVFAIIARSIRVKAARHSRASRRGEVGHWPKYPSVPFGLGRGASIHPHILEARSLCEWPVVSSARAFPNSGWILGYNNFWPHS